MLQSCDVTKVYPKHFDNITVVEKGSSQKDVLS